MSCELSMNDCSWWWNSALKQSVVQFAEEFGVPSCYLANRDGSFGDDFADALAPNPQTFPKWGYNWKSVPRTNGKIYRTHIIYVSYTYHILIIYLSHISYTYHVRIIYLSYTYHTYHIRIIYLSYTYHIRIIYLSYTYHIYHIRIIYLSYTYHILITYIIYVSYTYHILIIYLSYTYHILIIYLSYTYHIRIIYVSYTYHILITYIIYVSYTYHILIIYLSYTYHIRIIYLSYTYHIRIIYVSYTYHILIIYLSYTYHILIIYLSYTYHYPHLMDLKNHGFWPIHRRCYLHGRRCCCPSPQPSPASWRAVVWGRCPRSIGKRLRRRSRHLPLMAHVLPVLGCFFWQMGDIWHTHHTIMYY